MRQISLTRNKFALISDEDYERVSEASWRLQENPDGRFYAVLSGNPWCSMHRYIMGAKRSDQVVCHINEDGLDNRRENLILADNSANQHIRFKDAKGYHWESSRNKWKVMISIDGKAIYLGRFDNEEDAAKIYRKAKEEQLAKIFGGATDDDDADAEEWDGEEE